MTIFISVLGVLAAVIGYYVFTPQLALDNPNLLFLLMILGYALALGLTRSDYGSRGTRTFVWVGTISLTILFVLGSIGSSGMLRSSSYYQLLGEEKHNDFNKSLPPIDLKEPPLVSEDMALRAAEKQLSNVPALGSQTQVGQMVKQLVAGKLCWVGFLEYRGFFSWWNLGTTAGYVRVSATDPSDVQLVTDLKGRKLQMRYLTSAFFGDDAERYLRTHGYATAGLTDFSPEIDDDGRPYLVVTVFNRKVGFSGDDAIGIVVLDVQTGDSHYYPMADVPTWVDRVHPEELVLNQLKDRLEYVHGWINPSDKDKLQIAGDLDVVYGTNGRAYFYGGLSSTGGDAGLVGFVMIDTRTKEVTRYNLQGVTAAIAQATAEGVYPEKKYRATNPLPFMVEGRASYVMALRDGTGIARMYGIVDVSDYQRVAVANTIEEAARLYQFKQGIDRTRMDSAANPADLEVRGTIELIGSAVRGGNTFYELALIEQPGRIFIADVSLSEDLVLSARGHSVVIKALRGTSRVTPMVGFKDLNLDKGAPARSQ